MRGLPPESGRTSGRFCFPRGHRLVHPRQFQHVFRNPQVRRVRGKWLSLSWVANDLPHARIGFAVSKAAVRKSVHRNLVKRCVREHFRTHALPCVDLVVSCQRNAPVPTAAAIHAEARALWAKVML